MSLSNTTFSIDDIDSAGKEKFLFRIAKFFEKYSIQELSQKSDQWLNAQGRLIQPMFLPKGENNYRTIEWDEAFEMIKEKHGIDFIEYDLDEEE